MNYTAAYLADCTHSGFPGTASASIVFKQEAFPSSNSYTWILPSEVMTVCERVVPSDRCVSGNVYESP